MAKHYVIGGLKIHGSGDEIANLDQRKRKCVDNGTSRQAEDDNNN